MADVLLSNAADGGDIECTAGQITLDDGVASAVYISLFGANEDDTGDDSTKSLEWWANKIATNANEKLRGRLQNLLRSSPVTSGNLALFEEAAALDLAWMKDTGLASNIAVRCAIPALNWVSIEVKAEIQGRSFAKSFAKKAGLA